MFSFVRDSNQPFSQPVFISFMTMVPVPVYMKRTTVMKKLKGIPETYLEPCQTFELSAEIGSGWKSKTIFTK